MFSTPQICATLALSSLAAAHSYLIYPGWRGDNLRSNGTPGIDDFEPNTFPYGMQWDYPCGGMPISQNRTYWPIGGGAVAWEPGWFEGHKTALMYVNLGIWPNHTTPPANYSNVMQPMFQIIGPTNNAYPGQPVCFPQVPTPANYTPNEGDYGTIQVVMNAKHGAALYNCVDIIFTNNISLVEPISENNCRNSNQIEFTTMYSSVSVNPNATTSGALPEYVSPRTITMSSALLLAVMGMSLLL